MSKTVYDSMEQPDGQHNQFIVFMMKLKYFAYSLFVLTFTITQSCVKVEPVDPGPQGGGAFSMETDHLSFPREGSGVVVYANGLGLEEACDLSYSVDGGNTWTSTAPEGLTVSRLNSRTGEKTGVYFDVVARDALQNTAYMVFPDWPDNHKASIGSEMSPVDLSGLDINGVAHGAANTANCYRVSDPGWYTIPCVYGNAITAGEVNKKSYISEHSADEGCMQTFLNWKGNPISSPYILEDASNSGTSRITAGLIWNESPCNIVVNRSIQASASKTHSILFRIDPDGMGYGNAVIGLFDSEGHVVWSWHIWITDALFSDEPLYLSRSSIGTPTVLSHNVGQLPVAEYRHKVASCIVRFNKKDGQSDELTIHQEDFPEYVGIPSTLFQWGRKDPFPITNINEFVTDYNQNGRPYYRTIVEPARLMQWNLDNLGNVNLWDNGYYLDGSIIRHEALAVKTIYDPSPAGYCVMSEGSLDGYGDFDSRLTRAEDSEIIHGHMLKRYASDATGVLFPFSGTREYLSDKMSDLGIKGSYWFSWGGYAGAVDTRVPTTGYATMSSRAVLPFSYSNPYGGKSVRSMKIK